MDQNYHQDIILRQAVDAVARADRGQSEIDRRRGKPPRAGELFTLSRTAAYDVAWAVVSCDSRETEELLIVPTDLHPVVGPWDVSVAAGREQTALTLRCRCRLLVAPAVIDIRERSGILAPEIVKVVEARLMEIKDSEDSGRMVGWELEAEPESLYAEEHARQAMNVLRGHLL